MTLIIKQYFRELPSLLFFYLTLYPGVCILFIRFAMLIKTAGMGLNGRTREPGRLEKRDTRRKSVKTEEKAHVAGKLLSEFQLW